MTDNEIIAELKEIISRQNVEIERLSDYNANL